MLNERGRELRKYFKAIGIPFFMKYNKRAEEDYARNIIYWTDGMSEEIDINNLNSVKLGDNLSEEMIKKYVCDEFYIANLNLFQQVVCKGDIAGFNNIATVEFTYDYYPQMWNNEGDEVSYAEKEQQTIELFVVSEWHNKNRLNGRFEELYCKYNQLSGELYFNDYIKNNIKKFISESENEKFLNARDFVFNVYKKGEKQC